MCSYPSQDTDNDHVSPLPSFNPSSVPSFNWGVSVVPSFSKIILSCYSEIVHWCRNIFKVPSGKFGDLFVHELASLFQAYADTSSMKSMALHAAMVMPSLLLQRPHSKSKTKELIAHLDCTLTLWLNGDMEVLISEGRNIQERVCCQTCHSKKTVDNLAHKLMFEGAVLRLLSNEDRSGGTLLVDTVIDGCTIHDILVDKHPPSQLPIFSAIMGATSINDFHPIIFDSLDFELIRSMALKTDGSPGPSGLDTASGKCLCTSFRSSSTELYM